MTEGEERAAMVAQYLAGYGRKVDETVIASYVMEMQFLEMPMFRRAFDVARLADVGRDHPRNAATLQAFGLLGEDPEVAAQRAWAEFDKNTEKTANPVARKILTDSGGWSVVGQMDKREYYDWFRKKFLKEHAVALRDPGNARLYLHAKELAETRRLSHDTTRDLSSRVRLEVI